MKGNLQTKIFLFALILPFFLLLQTNLEGNSRTIGSLITYKHVSGKKYTIFLKRYRDCRGLALVDSQTMVMSTDASCVSNVSFVVRRTNIKNVTQQCVSSSTCNPQNTATSVSGIEEHTFSATIDFDSLPYKNAITNSCCKVYFSYSGALRAAAITAYNAGNEYNYAMLDVCLGAGNSSADYTNKTISAAVCNSALHYNPGVIDADGDSLVFSFDSPLQNSRTDTVTYNSPLSSMYPLTPFCIGGGVTCTPSAIGTLPVGFTFDSKNNDIILTPTNCSEYSTFVNRTDEYKKDVNGVYQLVGITRRDQNIEIVSYTNIPPTISDLPCVYACVGDTAAISIVSKDATPSGGVSDTTFLSWNKAIPNAIFTILDSNAKEKIAVLKWRPHTSDIRERPYYYNVMCAESNCGVSAQASKAGCFVVVDTLKPTYTLVDKLNGTLLLNASTTGGSSQLAVKYQWGIDSNRNLSTAISRVYAKDSIMQLNPGKYYVRLYVENGSNCPKIFFDSITIAPYFRFNFKGVKDTACQRSALSIKPIILDGVRPITYSWYESGSATLLSSDSILNYTVNKNTTLFLSATDANSANYSLEFNIFSKTSPDLSSVKNPGSKCLDFGRFDLLTPQPLGIGLAQAQIDSNALWFTMADTRRSIMVSAGIGTPYTYFTDRFFNATLNNNYIPANSIDSVILHAVHNRTGCVELKKIAVEVNKNPAVILKSKVFCQAKGNIRVNDNILAPTGSVLSGGIYTWKIDSAPSALATQDLDQILVNNGSIASPDYVFYLKDDAFSISAPINARRVGTYKLRFCFIDGLTNCGTCDSMYITISIPPAVVFSSFGNLCYNDDTVKLNNQVNLIKGRWELISIDGQSSGTLYNQAIGRMIDSSAININKLPGEYNFRYVNEFQGGCAAKDSVIFTVNPKPQFNIISERDTLYLGETTNLSASPSANFKWDNGSISDRNIREFAYPAGLLTFWATYADPTTTCTTADTIKILVVKEKRPVSIKSLLERGLSLFPNPAKDEVEITTINSFNTLKIIDVSGKEVYYQIVENTLYYKIDVSTYKSGVYFILLNGDNGDARLRLEVKK